MSQFEYDFAEITGDGNSETVTGRKGIKRVYLFGDFGGGTVSIDVSPDGVTFAELVTKTTLSFFDTEFSADEFIRLRMTGSTAPSVFGFLR